MRENINFIYYLLIVVFCINNTYAQNTKFLFYDVQTGFAITPESISIYDSNSDIINQFQKKNALNEQVNLNLKQGEYSVLINSNGYKQMDIGFKVEESFEVSRKIMLSPVNIPSEITVDYIRSLHQPDRTIIVGYVADDRGYPLQKATLKSDEGRTVYTNESGYFQLPLSYNKPEPNGMQLKSFTVSKQGFKTVNYEKVVVVPNGDATYRIQLEKGSGIANREMSDFIVEDGEIIGRPERQMMNSFDKQKNNDFTGQLKSTNSCVPLNISVGYKSGYGHCCSNSSCNQVIHLTLEDYVKQVLDNEWLSGWSSLNNIDEAYKAAAVAVRTYAAYRINNPRKPGTYHIYASTCDQDWDPSVTTWASSAGNATNGVVLKYAGNIVKAEYSSENNNKSGSLPSCIGGGYSSQAGCGNGKCKDGISGNCISDPLGSGWVQFGHGRNMSQFGSARWATGLAIGFWCNNPYTGQPHGYNTKNWQQILDMYYPSHDLVDCNGGIPPPSGGGNCQTNITTVTGTIPANTYQASNSIISAGTVSSGTVNFKSPDIELKNGFTITGGDFYAENMDCSGNKTNQPKKEISSIVSVYPNPFNKQTNISFSLSQVQLVSIWVNDISGKLISQIVNNEMKTAGQNQITFNADNISAGIYYLTIQTGKNVETQKIIITK